jgi:ssDNA-binding Zn-finger/Zn-ribbon topoisomerase 1
MWLNFGPFFGASQYPEGQNQRHRERERERERERCSNVNFKGAGKAAETKREGHRER